MDRTDAEDGIEVEISDTQGHLRADPAELTALIRNVLNAEGRRRASISLALVDQAAIHAISRSHLGHDWPTDVISFPLSEPDDRVLTGELVISAEMAAATAAEIGVDPGDELALYVVHGLLHLCGYDDLSDPEAAKMRLREGELLAACGRPNPFDRIGNVTGRTSLRAGRPGREADAMIGPSPPPRHQSEPSPWSR